MDKYLIVNRARDFARGLLVNVSPHGEGLILQKADGIAKGCVYLPRLDAGQRDFLWTRLVMDITEFEGFVRIGAFASDSDAMPGEEMTVQDYLCEPYVSKGVKQGALDPLFTKMFVGAKDVLLSLHGRYLYVKVELIATGEQVPILQRIKVKLAGDHMLDYLPTVYAKSDMDGFLYRYLSLFDTMVKDLEAGIDHFAENLDFDKQSGALLRYLASWVNVEESCADDETVREIVRTAVYDYERAQTPEGIKKLIARWTGARPILVEHFCVEQMQRQGEDTQLYVRLFGTQENCFHILLPQTCFASAQEAQAFMERLQAVLPAHVQAQLVLLRESIYLDKHTYVGVNSVITGHTDAAIHRRVAIEYDTVIGEGAQ